MITMGCGDACPSSPETLRGLGPRRPRRATHRGRPQGPGRDQPASRTSSTHFDPKIRSCRCWVRALERRCVSPVLGRGGEATDQGSDGAAPEGFRGRGEAGFRAAPSTRCPRRVHRTAGPPGTQSYRPAAPAPRAVRTTAGGCRTRPRRRRGTAATPRPTRGGTPPRTAPDAPARTVGTPKPAATTSATGSAVALRAGTSRPNSCMARTPRAPTRAFLEPKRV